MAPPPPPFPHAPPPSQTPPPSSLPRLSRFFPRIPRGFLTRKAQNPLSRNANSGAGEIATKAVLRVRKDPILTRTEQPKARGTPYSRQQHLEGKTESNTKSCGKPGTNRPKTTVSIERSTSREKHFSRRKGVGFYASPHEGKMTEKSRFANFAAKN